jgi:hypothetical protein
MIHTVADSSLSSALCHHAERWPAGLVVIGSRVTRV